MRAILDNQREQLVEHLTTFKAELDLQHL